MSPKTIETTVIVDAEGKATIQLPADIAPGLHRVFVTIDDLPDSSAFSVEDLPRHDIPWPFATGELFRREDVYGDDGR